MGSCAGSKTRSTPPPRKTPIRAIVALHRLNRKEYANAVRDLLALEVDAPGLLPQDDERERFDNIADALQVSPSFIEQYVSAARSVAVQAVGKADVRPGSQTYDAAPGTPNAHIDGLPLGTRGGILAHALFPVRRRVRDQHRRHGAGHIWVNNMEFENTVIVTLDGERLYETVIGGEEDMRRSTSCKILRVEASTLA